MVCKRYRLFLPPPVHFRSDFCMALGGKPLLFSISWSKNSFIMMSISSMLALHYQPEHAEVLKSQKRSLVLHFIVEELKRTHENTRFLQLHLPFQLYRDEDVFQLIGLILFKRLASVINQYPLSWKGIFQQQGQQFLATCLQIQSLKFLLTQQMDFIQQYVLIK